MAKETYKIIFLEDSPLGKAGDVKKGLSFDEQVDYMMTNHEAKKKGIFKIEREQTITQTAKTVVKKTDTEAYNEALEAFMDSLTYGEMSSVKEGKKKVCHNEQVGFYLRLVDSKLGNNDEIHISVQEIRNKEKREIYKSMKAYLLGMDGKSVSSLSNKFNYTNGMFDDEDLKMLVDDLFKGKC